MITLEPVDKYILDTSLIKCDHVTSQSKTGEKTAGRIIQKGLPLSLSLFEITVLAYASSLSIMNLGYLKATTNTCSNSSCAIVSSVDARPTDTLSASLSLML